MKKKLMLIFSAILLLVIAGCTSAPTDVSVAPEVKTVENVQPITIDFGPYWIGTVRLEKESDSSLGDNAEARFSSEWTTGENAGNVYPREFTLSSTGKEAKMDFSWDNGGDIPADTYNALVDIDGLPGTGTIKNLKLEKGTAYEVYITFNAAKIDIQLETDGDEVIAYPPGTHDKYENLGRLDNIPDELAITAVSSYTERNAIYWLVPAGSPLDIVRKHSNGTEEWFTDYTAIPESFIKHLP